METSTFISRAEARRRGIGLDVLIGPAYTKLFFDCYVPDTQEIHLATTQDKRSRTHGIRTHRYPVDPMTLRHSGIRITTAEQTFADLGTCLDLVELVVLGDSLVRKGRTTPDRLENWVTETATAGVIVARKAARLVRSDVDSAYESRLRLLIVFSGLPEPVVNYCIADKNGVVRRRLDLSYPHLMLAIEYDGRHHIDRQDQWQKDIARREELEAEGWRFIVVTSTDVHTRPAQVLDRMRDAMTMAGAKPPRRRQQWRRYFG